jgi:hypothetical protein
VLDQVLGDGLKVRIGMKAEGGFRLLDADLALRQSFLWLTVKMHAGSELLFDGPWLLNLPLRPRCSCRKLGCRCQKSLLLASIERMQALMASSMLRIGRQIEGLFTVISRLRTPFLNIGVDDQVEAHPRTVAGNRSLARNEITEKPSPTRFITACSPLQFGKPVRIGRRNGAGFIKQFIVGRTVHRARTGIQVALHITSPVADHQNRCIILAPWTNTNSEVTYCSLRALSSVPSLVVAILAAEPYGQPFQIGKLATQDCP